MPIYGEVVLAPGTVLVKAGPEQFVGVAVASMIDWIDPGDTVYYVPNLSLTLNDELHHFVKEPFMFGVTPNLTEGVDG